MKPFFFVILQMWKINFAPYDIITMKTLIRNPSREYYLGGMSCCDVDLCVAML